MPWEAPRLLRRLLAVGARHWASDRLLDLQERSGAVALRELVDLLNEETAASAIRRAGWAPERERVGARVERRHRKGEDAASTPVGDKRSDEMNSRVETRPNSGGGVGLEDIETDGPSENSNHNECRSLLKQTRQQPIARKASWISWRRS